MARPYIPQVEKRILPLIDITVILVGILILLIGNPEIGSNPVLVLEVSGSKVLHGSDVVASGDQIDENVARAAIVLAHSSGFSAIEIQAGETRHELSARQLTSIERQLKQIAIIVAKELETRSLPVRTTTRSEQR